MQDIIFYADNPRIDFESVVDWNSPHSLLKVGFKVHVLASEARFETQFGNIRRPTHENYPTDKTQLKLLKKGDYLLEIGRNNIIIP